MKYKEGDIVFWDNEHFKGQIGLVLKENFYLVLKSPKHPYDTKKSFSKVGYFNPKIINNKIAKILYYPA